MREREVKLALPGRFSVPALELDGEPLDARSVGDQTLRATYFDTADLRLARHGVTLRYRTGEGNGPTWTLKLPAPGAGRAEAGLLARDELHLDGPGREPPAMARSLVTAFARTRPLVAVATLRTRRRRIHLGRAGEDVAEIAIDEVSVVEGRHVVSRFRELELEDLRGDLALEQLAGQLRGAGATVAEPIPKVVRALGSRATAPPDVAPVPMGLDATVRDALRASIADALVRLLHHDPLARLGDPEGTHQVRVALRRLRSDLRSLGEAVDPQWRARVGPRLRATAAALGAARDLDVLTEHLGADGVRSRAALAPMFDELARRRAAARTELLDALRSPAYPQLLEGLVDAIAAPPATEAAADAAATQLPALVLDSWLRLKRRADGVDAGSPDEAFHRVRIAAKRTRYAAELAARALDGRRRRGAEAFAARLAQVQSLLGELQDAVVAEAVVREILVDRPRSAEVAFEAGRLVERQRRRAHETRDRFLAVWPEVRRPRWRRWASS